MFTYLPTENMGCFHYLAATNKEALNIYVQLSVRIYAFISLRSGMIESYEKCIFKIFFMELCMVDKDLAINTILYIAMRKTN